jgi:hypothetical protein
MPNFPNIHNINLEMCCIKTINRINQRIKLGNILQATLASSLWIGIFSPSPPSKLDAINTIHSIYDIDFQTLKNLIQTIQSVSIIEKKAARTDCESEWFRHIGNNKLEKFWRGMIDAFSD